MIVTRHAGTQICGMCTTLPNRRPAHTVRYDRVRKTSECTAAPTIYCWVQRFTPLLAQAAHPCRHRVGDRWWVDETYVKVSGRWRYVYRAIDQFEQVIDVYVSPRRDGGAARRFFTRALATTKVVPEVTTDNAAVYPHVLDGLTSGAWHCTKLYATDPIESDHGRDG
jgi:IS6 family transposase